jgi:hypothetical protein
MTRHQISTRDRHGPHVRARAFALHVWLVRQGQGRRGIHQSVAAILAREGHQVAAEVIAEWAARYGWAARAGAAETACSVPGDIAAVIAQIGASAESPQNLRDLRILSAAVERLSRLALGMMEKASEALDHTHAVTVAEIATLAATSATVLRVATTLRLAVIQGAPEFAAPVNVTPANDDPQGRAPEGRPSLSEAIAAFEAGRRRAG